MSSKCSRCDNENSRAARDGGPAFSLALREAVVAAGAAAWGVAEAGEVDAAETERFDRFIAEGRHATMDYLERYREIRANPLHLLAPQDAADTPGPGGTPSEGSVIVCAFPYAADYEPAPGADRIARYALGDDYHEALRKRLKPVAALLRGAGFLARVCVDSAPIMERYWAGRAGLGRVGLNHQLIIPGLGSYFFLAEIVTDAAPGALGSPSAEVFQASNEKEGGGCCAGCGACARACPTGALRPDGSFDARLCVNYLTIEHRGELPERVGGRPVGEVLDGVLYGCDRCQECCPCNRGVAAEPLPEFRPRPALLTLNRATLDTLTPEARATLLRRSPLRRGLNRR